MIVALPMYFGDTATRLKKLDSVMFFKGCTSLLGPEQSRVCVTRLGWRKKGENKNNTRVGVELGRVPTTEGRQQLYLATSLFCVDLGVFPGFGSGEIATLFTRQFTGFLGSAVLYHQLDPVHRHLHHPLFHFNAEDDIAIKHVPGFALANSGQVVDVNRAVFPVEAFEITGCPSQIFTPYQLVELFVIIVQKTLLQVTGDFAQIVVEGIRKVRHFGHACSFGGLDVVVKLFVSYNHLSLLSKGFHYV